MANSKKDPTTHQPPWGRTAGLLIACVSTIVGAIQGAGPTYLLYRACVGGIIACVVVHFFVRLVTSSTTVAHKS